MESPQDDEDAVVGHQTDRAAFAESSHKSMENEEDVIDGYEQVCSEQAPLSAG